MDDFAKEEALINCCQKRPWLQSIKVYILQKIASPSNFRTCMDVCKCFAQMRKPQKNSSVKMHITLVVSWIPRNSFLLPPLLARQALGTIIGLILILLWKLHCCAKYLVLCPLVLSKRENLALLRLYTF